MKCMFFLCFQTHPKQPRQLRIETKKFHPLQRYDGFQDEFGSCTDIRRRGHDRWICHFIRPSLRT